jgi:RNA polymerase sigma-70 factor (ECF subfamily)
MALHLDELDRFHHARLHALDVDGFGGDRDEATSFEETYDRYRARILRMCISRLGDRHEAEDVTQETFVRAWRTGLTLSDQERCYAWLRVVAGNLCVDHLRRRGRCRPSAEIEPGTAEAADDVVIHAGDVQMVRTALQRLNDRHRSALEQRETAGWTYEQMAVHAGTSIASVESRLWRARQALKREFTAIAGADGALAGLPVIGLLVRKVSQTRARVRGFLGAWVLPQANSGAPVMATVIGSCVAACAASLSGLLGSPAPQRPATAIPAAMAAASSPAVVPGSSSSNSGGAAAVATTSTTPERPPRSAPPAGRDAAAAPTSRRLRVQNPLTSTNADPERDTSMPVNANVGGVTVGVDPGAVSNFAGVVVNRPLVQRLQQIGGNQ